VHARFYYMLWDTNNAKPVDPQGASTLISEVTMTGPISKFDTSSDQPNWTLLGTQFNTGDASHFPDIQGGNVSLVFWVVVWMQDSSGLVSELPNHGLPAIPGAFASWTAALNFECQSADNCYSSKADINPLSNNIGIYGQPLYIANPNVGVTPGPVNPSVNIGKLEVSAARVAVAQQVNVSAIVSAEGADAGTMSVNFYDGDPKQGGQLFDVERIAHITEGTDYKAVASYRPNTCGTHELFAVINQGEPNEIVRRAPSLRVLCNPWY